MYRKYKFFLFQRYFLLIELSLYFMYRKYKFFLFQRYFYNIYIYIYTIELSLYSMYRKYKFFSFFLKDIFIIYIYNIYI